MVVTERVQEREGPLLVAVTASGILVLIAAAELVTTLVHALTGMVMHALLLSGLILAASALGEAAPDSPAQRLQRLLYGLTPIPLIRILSLSMPLERFGQTYWYLIVGIPVLAATLVVMAMLGLRLPEVGLRLGRPALHLPLALLGLGLGIIEYHILGPQPLIDDLTIQQFVVPALVLLVATGFLEELLFRGMLQQAASPALGSLTIIYVSTVFALLHIGYESAPDVAFVFGIALIYGWAAKRTGSIMGVSLSHGITNIMLFLVVPFVPILTAWPSWLTLN